MPGFRPMNVFERVLAPLLLCEDCDGRGERWHAKWPELPYPSASATEVPLAEATVEKSWGLCETCGGDGRMRFTPEGPQ